MTAILLVEDHGDTRDWLKSLLTNVYQSPSIIEAATVASANKAIQQQTFDLAVLDIGLPDGRWN